MQKSPKTFSDQQVRRSLSFCELPDWKLKEVIDAQQLYASYRSALEEAEKFRGRLHWERVANTEYLVSTRYALGVRQRKSLGLRDDRTEELARDFAERAAASRQRLEALTSQVDRQARVNRALRLGDVPALLANVLMRIENVGLSKDCLTLGPNAMHAFAAAASATFAPTQLYDLLGDSTERLQIASSDPLRLARILQEGVNPFAKVAKTPFTLLNDEGHRVELIHRNEGHRPGNPGARRPIEEVFWVSTIHDVNWLLAAPKFEQVIISTNGSMTTMTTVDPRAYVLFKVWLSEQTERDAVQRRRDYAQAAAVSRLVHEWLPHLPFTGINREADRL